MGIFDLFRKKSVVPKNLESTTEEISKTENGSAKKAKKSPKELATERGEPYIAILSMDVNPDDINAGVFELDWNEKFIANLIRAGYQGRTDSDLVDQWFQNVCRNVVLETWEQEQAMNNSSRYTQSRDIGDGRREVS
jgi:predicted transcriptional regulator YheO